MKNEFVQAMKLARTEVGKQLRQNDTDRKVLLKRWDQLSAMIGEAPAKKKRTRRAKAVTHEPSANGTPGIASKPRSSTLDPAIIAAVRAVLSPNIGLNAKQIQATAKVGRSQAKRALDILNTDQIVNVSGSGRGRKYLLAEESNANA